MEITMKLLVIAVAVISMALAPSFVMINSVDASTHYCTDYPGKSQNWINGCQQGWWDHNHCNSYSPDGESNAFYSGYKVGWNKGQCKASPHYCTDYPGKSQNWINGCQQGWWDHNHCQDYSSGLGQYAQGYNVGWSKGHCK
jgi:hypothetical protein